MDLDALLEAPEGIKWDIASLPWNEHWDSAGAQGLWAADPWWQQLSPHRPHSMQGPEVLARLPQHLGFCGPRAAWAGADWAWWSSGCFQARGPGRLLLNIF